jgi:LDH2 family malate/lactate/ureidoglycolate dehydrogenase
MARRLHAAPLAAWSRALLEASGLEPAAAATVADTLVEASLRGVDSHGVTLLPIYAERLRAGSMNRRPRPRVERREGAVACVDGDHGPGQVAGVLAMDVSVELAREHGVGMVTARRSGHYGAAAYYVMRPARQGLVALSTTNSEPFVVPFGGRGWALGTNPIALSAPTPTGELTIDMATSQVAANKVAVARYGNEPIPEGWAVDEQGRPTTDPDQAYAMLPLGGYKGYALAVLVEILSGALPGAGVTHGVGRLHEELERPQDVGHFHLTIDPERTVGAARLAQLVQALADELKAMPPLPGTDEVLVPGEPQLRNQALRERDGIPIPDGMWASLAELSDLVGVAPPSPLPVRHS